MSLNNNQVSSKDQDDTKYKPVSLISNPIITLKTLFEIILEKTILGINYLTQRTYIIL